MYRDDIPKRKIADVNAALSLVCDQLKTKYLKLNEHILSNHFNWDEIHLKKSGTMALATKTSEDIQPSTRSDDENRLETQPNPRKDKQKFTIKIYNMAKAQKLKVFFSRLNI